MDHLPGYERWLTLEKKAAANTLSSYLRDVRQFLSFLSASGLEPERVGQRTLEQFVKHLTTQGKSKSTITRSIASLKSFYTYLQIEGYVTSNPAKSIAPIRA